MSCMRKKISARNEMLRSKNRHTKQKTNGDQKKKKKTIATNSNKQQMFYENKMDYIFMWMFVSRE